MEEDLHWYDHTELPELISDSENGFSVDVLIYNVKTKERIIGWFDYNQMKWLFFVRLSGFEKFKWRYFTDEYDKPQK